MESEVYDLPWWRLTVTNPGRSFVTGLSCGKESRQYTYVSDKNQKMLNRDRPQDSKYEALSSEPTGLFYSHSSSPSYVYGYPGSFLLPRNQSMYRLKVSKESYA